MTLTPDTSSFDTAVPATPVPATSGTDSPTAAASVPARRAERVEWPTLALAVGIYGGWTLAMLAAGTGAVPIWLWAPAAAWCVAWQASLQHEVIHGHPTPSAALNRWVAGPPLALWLSYERYRFTHLQHHVDERLTDPLDDPESFYVTEQALRRAGRSERLLLRALNTLSGRLVLGPLWAAGRSVLS